MDRRTGGQADRRQHTGARPHIGVIPKAAQRSRDLVAREPLRAQTVEVWPPDTHFPVVEDRQITWHPAEASEPLVISLTELFRAP